MLDLQAIELIKQLKARYFRAIDTGNIEMLQGMLTDDVALSFKSPAYEFRVNGLDDALEFYRTSFTKTRLATHNGHTPEIEVDGDHATALWYLSYVFINLEDNTHMHGSAIYQDRYVKRDGRWMIAETGYQTLLETVEPLSEHLQITSRPIN
ncbi:nuclear transport factor 2 family protein [Pseudomonas sp. 14P_8.1_Bac3]|uniref:nuclear transport factor 2 family protein n=1 Tax=Pseudomonas sp. 14P_8.1_Bac3 TaxID=2971621 RepID=UPI0021CA5942|nr:nuclear transport factor 2 family protein [Pseudomonas sp. 14P_8.1_Bac3]MCU1758641.1 nuclear transport factor 2 family protein [Pseudomonas sp. 14P_8.1_Bac3]